MSSFSATSAATFENSIRTVSAGTPAGVKEYYGTILTKTDDLKTSACVTSGRPDDYVIEALKKVSCQVKSKYYGCGLVVPQQLSGLRVLDLGCGSGRDCYMLAQWVGPTGFVVGVDMTLEQLDVANANIDWHTQKNGYEKPNVEFRLGYIERLSDLAFEDNSFDIIISNCVINLSPDKEAVIREAYRILKPGGEIFFSDVYSSRRIPLELRQDQVLWGECISGALYWNDFHRLAKQCGFTDPRIFEDRPLEINNKEIEMIVGHIDFYSATYRLWKIPELEPDCEDYGQAVIYKGTIERCPIKFKLDGHHVIEKGKVFPVCGNTYRMLHDTRFRDHFEFIGDFSTHYGIYADCGKSTPFKTSAGGPPSTGACSTGACSSGGCC